MLEAALQLLVMVTPDWDAIQGTLYRFEKTVDGWHQITSPIAANVGQKGLGWGRGVYDVSHFKGPIKKEGDYKAPAGLFEIGTAFGYAESLPGLKLDYLHCSKDLEWIDDPASRYYNRAVYSDTISDKDWKSSEVLWLEEVLYKIGLFVKHNVDPVIPGDGSCIFMHIWRSPEGGSSGCTIMEEMAFREILYWLDPQKKPLLVQLPQALYSALQQSWHLPTLTP